MMANPLAPINVVQELLSRHLRQQLAAQRHMVHLGVQFGYNLVSEAAAHLIRETSAQITAFEHTPYQAMMLLIVDHLQQRNRWLLLHRTAPPAEMTSVDDDSDNQPDHDSEGWCIHFPDGSHSD